MSDSTDQGGAGGDFRGSREEKRQDETIMINSENLSEMVASAKGAGAMEPTDETNNDDELADSPLGRILVIAGIIAIIIAVAILVWVNVLS